MSEFNMHTSVFLKGVKFGWAGDKENLPSIRINKEGEAVTFVYGNDFEELAACFHKLSRMVQNEHFKRGVPEGHNKKDCN